MKSWDRRLARAQQLQQEYPAAGDLLRFYREIARFQKEMQRGFVPVSPSLAPTFSLHPAQVPEPVRRYLQPLLDLIVRTGPPALARVAGRLTRAAQWDPADAATHFVARVLVQPYAQHLALWTSFYLPASSRCCPFCREKPLVVVIRPTADPLQRSMVCSLCFTEWSYREQSCASCGEQDQQKLPAFAAEEFPHIHIEACETCREYVKAIDLTRESQAVPEVDEIASLPLDMWATSKGFHKLQGNLFGL